MREYFVPIERRHLPITDANRWLILPVEASNPAHAMSVATHTARAILGREHLFTTWAAVSYEPSFAHMAELRAEFDAVSDRKRTYMRDRVAKAKNSMTSFSTVAFA